MSFLSGKKLLLLGFIVVLLVIIPLTVYLVQQQQKLKVGANPQTVLSFNTPSTTVTPGQPFPVNILISPNGNQISFLKLTIQYDNTKLATAGAGLVANTSVFPSTLQGPIYTSNTASITLSVGTNSQPITSAQTAATINFQALPSSATTTTQISFQSNLNDPQNSQTQALSVGSTDQFNENVLLLQSLQPIIITVSPSSASTSPSPSSSTSSTQTQGPVCTGINVDKSTTGTAPWPINLQATGTTSTGTINKVTFTWGDTQFENVATGSGILSNSVNIVKNHTYNNAGTFTATVTFTDNFGNISQIGACTKTFNIAAASASPSPTSGSGTGTGTSTTQTVIVVSPSPTPIVIPSPSPIAQGTGATTKGGLPATGPGDKIVSFGTLGIVSTIIGFLLLFGL